MSVKLQTYLDILQNSHVQQILVKKIIEKLKAHIDDDTRFYLITEKSLNLSLFKDDKKTWKSLLIDKSGSTRGSASPSGTLQPAPAPPPAADAAAAAAAAQPQLQPPPAAGPDSLSNTGTKALQDWYLINALQANSSTQRTDNIIEFIKLMSEYNGNPFEEILIIRDATYSVTDSSSSLLYQITNTLRNDTDFNNIFSELIRKLKTLHNYPNLQMFRVQLKKIIDGNASNHSNLVWQFIRILYWKINNTPGALSSWHKLSRNKLPGLYHIRSEYFKVGVRAAPSSTAASAAALTAASVPPPTMSPTGSPTDNMNDKLNSVATNIKNDDLPSAQSAVQRLISSRPTGLGNAANRIRNLLDGILRIIRGAISSGDSKLPPPQRESVSKNIKEIKTIIINNSNNNNPFAPSIPPKPQAAVAAAAAEAAEAARAASGAVAAAATKAQTARNVAEVFARHARRMANHPTPIVEHNNARLLTLKEAGNSVTPTIEKVNNLVAKRAAAAAAVAPAGAPLAPAAAHRALPPSSAAASSAAAGPRPVNDPLSENAEAYVTSVLKPNSAPLMSIPSSSSSRSKSGTGIELNKKKLREAIASSSLSPLTSSAAPRNSSLESISTMWDTEADQIITFITSLQIKINIAADAKYSDQRYGEVDQYSKKELFSTFIKEEINSSPTVKAFILRKPRNEQTFNDVFVKIVQQLKTRTPPISLTDFKKSLDDIINSSNSKDHLEPIWLFIRILLWKVNQERPWYRPSRNKTHNLTRTRGIYFNPSAAVSPGAATAAAERRQHDAAVAAAERRRHDAVAANAHARAPADAAAAALPPAVKQIDTWYNRLKVYCIVLGDMDELGNDPFRAKKLTVNQIQNTYRQMKQEVIKLITEIVNKYPIVRSELTPGNNNPADGFHKFRKNCTVLLNFLKEKRVELLAAAAAAPAAPAARQPVVKKALTKKKNNKTN